MRWISLRPEEFVQSFRLSIRQLYAAAISTLLCLSLTACIGANPFCGGATCPADQVRDTFCGCTSTKNTPPTGHPAPYNGAYMTARYTCVEALDTSQHRGVCDQHATGASCEAAKNTVLQTVAARGDICQHCAPPDVDHTKVWDGNPPEWIQGGPCSGESANPTQSSKTEIASLTDPLDLPLQNPVHFSDVLNPQPAAFLAIATPAAIPITSCIQSCPKDHLSPDCTVSTIDVAYDKPLSELYTRADKKVEDIVTPEQLRKLFNVDTSYCERKATTLSPNGVENTGDHACNIHTQVGNQKLFIYIDVPPVLHGTWDSTGSNMKLVFDDPSKRPNLHFTASEDPDDTHPMNDDFGGPVLWFEANKDVAFMKTTKGCIGAKY